MDLATMIKSESIIPEDAYEEFLKRNKVVMKEHELKTIGSFISTLKIGDYNNFLEYYFNYFFVGYKIPQIGEEFDLLRFGTNFNVNIELKQKATDEAVLRQLKRKKHYLGILNCQTLHFCYREEDNSIVSLGDQLELIKYSADDLMSCLEAQKVLNVTLSDADRLFNPADFLISPFNATDAFIKGDYFLTQHQYKIQQLIKSDLFKNKESHLIEGKAGTGKTLLIYNLAKELMHEDKKVMIIHCGKLNDGHRILNSKYGFSIQSIKSVKNPIREKDTDIIIIDECQRIKKEQLLFIQKYAKQFGVLVVYSLDPEQCLSNSEIRTKIKEEIILNIPQSNVHRLKNKIRTNVEMAEFIKKFFKHDKNDIPLANSNRNIQLKYFKSYNDGLIFWQKLSEKGWTPIKYTPSLHSPDPFDVIDENSYNNSHDVIGQEFDKVCIIIDNNFNYQKEGDILTLEGTNSSYYHSSKMLFQNMTRSRKKLCLIIIENKNLFIEVSKLLEVI